MDSQRAAGTKEFLSQQMDDPRAVAISEVPSQVIARRSKIYEEFHEELGAIPDAATATEAIEELAQGRKGLFVSS